MKRMQMIVALAALGSALVLGGCSQDKHVFHSSIARPATLHVTDSLTGEDVWSRDIPVEHRLVVNFDYPGRFQEPTYRNQPAKVMSWRLFREGHARPEESDSVTLPGTPVLMRLTYRDAPEYPGEMPRGRQGPRMQLEELQTPPRQAPPAGATSGAPQEQDPFAVPAEPDVVTEPVPATETTEPEMTEPEVTEEVIDAPAPAAPQRPSIEDELLDEPVPATPAEDTQSPDEPMTK